MVATSDLTKVNNLYAEVRNLTQALKMLDENGVITSMMIGIRSEVPPELGGGTVTMRAVSVDTAGMDPPQQMMTAIKQQMTDRLAHAKSELQGMGISVDTVETAPAAPAAAMPAAAPTPAQPQQRPGGRRG